MANVSLNFDVLTQNHPSWRHIRALVSNIPKIVDNTCCVQLSFALNRSGGVIEDYEFKDGTLATGKVRAFASSDGMNYIYAVPDMKVYLNKRYGLAENFTGSKQSVVNKIGDRQGILAFGHFHIDLFMLGDIHRPDDYLQSGGVLWNNASPKLRGFFFWEVTSEWGF